MKLKASGGWADEKGVEHFRLLQSVEMLDRDKTPMPPNGGNQQCPNALADRQVYGRLSVGFLVGVSQSSKQMEPRWNP